MVGMKQRRLEELWDVGTEVTVDDGRGEPVVVWLQKLNDPETDLCWRRAAAARARVLAARDDPDSDIYGAALDSVYNYATHEDLVKVAIAEELDKQRQSVRAELEGAEDSEWAKDGYLQGLRDLWFAPTGTLAVTFLKDQEDVEAKRVFAELQRFEEQVSERLADARRNLEESYGQMSDAQLVPLCVKRHVQVKADQAWNVEYERAQLWRAVRHPDNHDVHYFDDRAGLDRLSDQCRDYLLAAYNELLVGVVEGKDLPAAPDSSLPSEPPNVEATERSSGLAVVGA